MSEDSPQATSPARPSRFLSHPQNFHCVIFHAICLAAYACAFWLYLHPALAHITGGGLTENIPRVLRAGLEVVLQRRAWPRSAVFEWLARAGHIEEAEMHRTFNCGIGMVAIVGRERADEALRLLAGRGETALLLGEVRRGDRGVVIESDR